MERLWAPWRMSYISGVDDEKPEGCFFCSYWNNPGRDAENFVLARYDCCYVVLNRYPYTNGHLMVVPVRHAGSIEDIDANEGGKLWHMTAMAKRALTKACNPDGFNIGINQGRVAGAGVVDHVHIHVVPRWNGDVNFMPVFSDVRVIPQALEETYALLAPVFRDLME